MRGAEIGQENDTSVREEDNGTRKLTKISTSDSKTELVIDVNKQQTTNNKQQTTQTKTHLKKTEKTSSGLICILTTKIPSCNSYY